MTTDRLMRIIPGLLIMASLVLYSIYHPEAKVFSSLNWLLLTLFVGVNLFQSGFTRWCLLEKILNRMGFNKARRAEG